MKATLAASNLLKNIVLFLVAKITTGQPHQPDIKSRRSAITLRGLRRGYIKLAQD